MRVFALRPPPVCPRVYQPAALPERERVRQVGGLFTLTGNSTNGRLSLELVIPGFQGFGRDYDVLHGSAAATVSVLDRETNQDYDNAYPVPDAPPGGTIFAGAGRFSGRHARMAFGIIGLPNPNYTATLQIRGGVRCRYVKPTPARAAA
jgi:hypothetical protein